MFDVWARGGAAFEPFTKIANMTRQTYNYKTHAHLQAPWAIQPAADHGRAACGSKRRAPTATKPKNQSPGNGHGRAANRPQSNGLAGKGTIMAALRANRNHAESTYGDQKKNETAHKSQSANGHALGW